MNRKGGELVIRYPDGEKVIWRYDHSKGKDVPMRGRGSDERTAERTETPKLERETCDKCNGTGKNPYGIDECVRCLGTGEVVKKKNRK